MSLSKVSSKFLLIRNFHLTSIRHSSINSRKLSLSLCDGASSRRWLGRHPSRVFALRASYFHRQCSVQLQDHEHQANVSGNRKTDFIIRSPYPDIEIPDNVSVPHLILNRMAKYGNTVALIDGITGEQMTYSELHTSVAKVTSAFVKLGLAKGDVVTIFSPNCIEFVIASLAIGAAGAIVSPVNPAYTSGELQHAMSHARARFLITLPKLLPTAGDAIKQCPHIKEVIVFGEADQCRPFSDLLQDDMSKVPENLHFHPKTDVCCLPFSSGTTGLPKAVMLSHYNLVANIRQLEQKETMDYKDGEDCLLAILPFFHIYGLVVVMLAGMFCGIKLVILPNFQPVTFLEAIQKYRVTFLHIAPPLLLFLEKHPAVRNYDLSSINKIVFGAAPAPISSIHAILNQLGNHLDLRQGYGLTETSPMVTCNSPENNKYHTVGPAVCNTQFKILDPESGDPLGTGKSGEICVRGPQVMLGYFENEKATRETLVDGWLRTGDVGHFDEDNHLIIDDRIKELIKVKGLQVAPAELEAILVSHPSVQDAGVVGKKHEKLGEAPTAFVVLKPKAKASVEELMRYVDERVAPHKRLMGGIEFRSEIPKSASGKILRRILKAEIDQN